MCWKRVANGKNIRLPKAMEVFQYAESPNSIRMKCGTMFLGELFGRVVGCDMSPDEKRDRLLEAASAVLEHATDNRLNAVCLNKAIFYLDLVSLRDLGHPVTYAPFIALQNGPVVAKYDERLIGGLENAGIAVQEVDGKSKPIHLMAPVKPYRFVDPSLVPAIKLISRQFSGNSSSKASDLSHKNRGWEMAYNDGLGGGQKPLAINMLIAMQQIIGNDPWMKSSLSDEEEVALNAADDVSGVPW